MSTIYVTTLAGGSADFTPAFATIKRNPIFSTVVICIAASGYEKGEQ